MVTCHHCRTPFVEPPAIACHRCPYKFCGTCVRNHSYETGTQLACPKCRGCCDCSKCRHGKTPTSTKRGACLSSVTHLWERKLQENDILIESLKEKMKEVEENRRILVNTILEKDILIEKMKEKMKEGEEYRKILVNTILDLKGKIRVFCRVRPRLSHEGVGKDPQVFSFPTSVEEEGRGITLHRDGRSHHFIFDQVFAPDKSQEEVFKEISQLVEAVLDGSKVCISAYGQTGSGKTYTMMGEQAEDKKGLIPRSLEQVFQRKQILKGRGWKSDIQVSMLEIYNDAIHDLLATDKSTFVAGKQCAIKHDALGNLFVTNLTIVDVCSSTEVDHLLKLAAQKRSVGKTQMNEQSSRSHMVFTLRIISVNESNGEQVQGVLNMIDLAGTERVKQSELTGDRLKETQFISKTLSAVINVISALAKKKKEHVPFRNSKLTTLLEPCLSGDSKALLFISLSPNATSVRKSLNALRFAKKAGSCELS